MFPLAASRAWVRVHLGCVPVACSWPGWIRLPATMLKIQQLQLSVLAIQVFVLACFFSHQYNSNNHQAEKPARVHVLIISSWRSGSSFVGQLFSQHPDVFYLMEPAWHVWATMYQNGARVLQMPARDLVRSVFLCDMSVFDAYLPAKRTKSAIFQWETSRALCSPPACVFFQRTDIISKDNCKTVCSKYPFSKVEEACKTYSHVVLKEVRFFDLKVLFPLLADPSLNLRIIHLVRDPRAVYYSRKNISGSLARDNKIVTEHKKLAEDMAIYAIMEEICKSHVKIYTAGRETFPGLFQGRYQLVRYEDIVHDPLAEVAELYKFAGLSFTPGLQSWVYNITHGKGLGKQPFDTSSRDALKASRAWRKNLPYPQVAKLQDTCKEAMKLLGYQLVSSEEEQKDLSLGLLHPLKPQATSTLSSDS
ncbi:carbohydrate sulfotransferase 4 [Pogona vitticeps]